MTYGSYAGKQPVYMNSIWKCTCGYINNSDEEKCQNCSIEIGKLKGFDMEQLKADCSARLEKEEQARQEAKKRAEEEQKRKEAEKKRLEAEEAERQRLEADKRKRNKKIGLIICAVAVCIGGVVVTNTMIIPDINYNKAVSLIESESYDEAFALLEKIGSYKDAETVYQYAKDYLEARSALESGSYSEAISGFNYLASSDYKDSRKLLEQAIEQKNLSQYEKGLSLLESGAYDEAIECFKSLGEYKDSKEQVEKAIEGKYLPQYENALTLLKNGSYKEAEEIFNALGYYKDSSEMAEKSRVLSKFSGIKVGHTVRFGEYYWQVLEITDNKVLIIPDECVDFEMYGPGTWENCALREYLNNDFYKEFTDSEKSIILDTKLTNEDNPKYGTEGGSNTTDKVFLLSLEEAKKYLLSSKKRKWHGRYEDWWLRTPGSDDMKACCVTEEGDFSIKGTGKYIGGGVCPAMWISLE